MKKIIIRYGLYGVAVMVAVLLPTYFIFKNKPNWDLQEIIGYTTIVVSLLFVYFGIRQWRDRHNGGQLSFGRGLGLGSLITLFPSAAFGLFSWIEIKLDPGFLDRYYDHKIAELTASTAPEKLPAALKEIADVKEMFSSPLMQFGVMFLTVFMIGFIITIISALILRRNRKFVTA